MNGQIGGGPPATGQSERSMHVLPVAFRVAGLMAQLSIATTLSTERQMTNNERKKFLIVEFRFTIVSDIT